MATLAPRIQAAKERREALLAQQSSSGVTGFTQTPSGGAEVVYRGKNISLQGPSQGGESFVPNATSIPELRQASFGTSQTSTLGNTTTGTTGTPSGTAAGTAGITPGQTSTVPTTDVNMFAGAPAGAFKDNRPNPDYIPSSEAEAIELAGDDPYTRSRWLANYYNSKGITNVSSEATPASFEEAAKLFKDQQTKEKSSLETKISEAKGDLAQKTEADIAGAQANLLAGRESVVSKGNVLAKDQAELTIRNQYDRGMRDLNEKLDQLNRLQQEQQANLIGGRAEDIARIQNNIEKQKQAASEAYEKVLKQEQEKEKNTREYLQMLQKDDSLGYVSDDVINYLKEGMPGAPPELIDILHQSAKAKVSSQQEKDKLSAMKDSIGFMQDMVTSGVALTPQSLQSMSASTGLPLETLMSFNERAQMVMQDKDLDTNKKRAELGKLSYELDREARGIVNADLEKADYVANMYRSGASPDEIMRTKQLLGIEDMDDPMYRAELAYKKAQTEYQQSQTAENYSKLKDAESSYFDIQGNSTDAYVPINSLENIKSSYKGGKLIISSKKPMQCGEFVNRFWGLPAGGRDGMGNSIQDKTALIKRNGYLTSQVSKDNFTDKIKPGMAFVTTVGKYGHTGIVTAVYPDGTFDTMEANIGDRNPNIPDPPIPRTRSLKDGDLVGFAFPPKGKTKLEGSIKGGKNPAIVNIAKDLASATDYTKKLKEIKSLGLSKDEIAQVMQEADKIQTNQSVEKPQSSLTNMQQRIFDLTNNTNVFDVKSAFWKDFSNLSPENQQQYINTLESKTSGGSSGGRRSFTS